MADAFEVLSKLARARRDVASQAVGVAQQRLAMVRRELANLDAIERGTRPTDETMFATGTFLCQLNRRKRQLLDQVPGLERTLEAAKQDLLEAHGEFKRIDLLRTREEQFVQREQDRRESLEVDELTQISYARQVRS
jgi:flagellar export protein FliJ